MSQLNMLEVGRAMKDAGIARALGSGERRELLAKVQRVARRVGQLQLDVTADDVAVECERLGIDYRALGPAVGALFGDEWEFTGRRTKSQRPRNHTRELKIWRLRAI